MNLKLYIYGGKISRLQITPRMYFQDKKNWTAALMLNSFPHLRPSSKDEGNQSQNSIYLKSRKLQVDHN